MIHFLILCLVERLWMTFNIKFQLTVKMSKFLITYSKLSRQQLVEEGLL